MTRPERVCGMGAIEVDSNRGNRLNDREEGQGQFSQETVIQMPSYISLGLGFRGETFSF